MMKRVNIVRLILLLLFIIPMAADFYSTFQAGEFVQHLEANVIYPFVGMWGIFFVNLFIIGAILWHYPKLSNSGKFGYISIVLWLATIRSYVVYTNMKTVEVIQSGAITLEEAAAIPQQMKVWQMGLLTLSILFPWLLTHLCFLIFKIEHKVIEKCG